MTNGEEGRRRASLALNMQHTLLDRLCCGENADSYDAAIPPRINGPLRIAVSSPEIFNMMGNKVSCTKASTFAVE